VTFDIDVDGILSVKARKRNWCRTISNYSSASNLNENEVDEMLAEAENMLLRIRKNVKLLI
jgi:molecular chaperone DnaK (HSP70)